MRFISLSFADLDISVFSFFSVSDDAIVSVSHAARGGRLHDQYRKCGVHDTSNTSAPMEPARVPVLAVSIAPMLARRSSWTLNESVTATSRWRDMVHARVKPARGLPVTYAFQKTAIALFVAALISPAQATVIGVADSSNCIPFGCTTGGFFYQQVYSAASFSAPININEITFYNSFTPGGFKMTGTFDLYFSLTSAPIATFDTSDFTFPDSSFAHVFSGSLPAVSSGRLDFSSLSSFLYDPSLGNLVLTVRSFDAAAVGTDSSKWLYLDADGNVGVTNSRFSAFPSDRNQGLVTGFNDAAAVPGPIVGAGLPGLVLAFGGLIAWARRVRRRDQSSPPF